MYCPKCKHVVSDEHIICPYCNMKLVNHLDKNCGNNISIMNPKKVMSVANNFESESIMKFLYENNIPCFTKSKSAGEYLNLSMGYSVFGEDIYVDEKDYTTVLSLLNDIKLETTPENDVNDTYHICFFKKPQFIARILLILIALALILMFIVNFL